MRLNESYGNIRSQILAKDPLPNINKVYSLVLQEETRRLLVPQLLSSENTALAVNSLPSFNKNFQPRGQQYTRNRPRPKCDHCGQLGHIQARCYALHGYPPNHPKSKASPEMAKGGHTQNGSSANVTTAATVLSQLTEDQLSKLTAWLSADDKPAAANVAGPFVEEADWSG
ncbi:uncharacterized protein LOC116264966 [Nymphaea colorata]|uniref:uncharacterized protein LOC116264966 n=1 Tax=Nymphaea colorata TaxID=210225 RepID=UPI00129DE151|nr:uncharacterized protein LOC116264966 [Nymphaea colorata]